MKHVIVFVLLLSSVSAARADDARSVDPKLSHATFSVQHVLIERVSGSVPIASASVTLGADGVTPVAVDATLEPGHINTGDGDRDGDLTGSNWFDTKKFPVWTFKSTRVEPNADGTYAISGLLTIHGTSLPIVLATAVVRGGPHPAYHATTTVNRHAFGMVVTRTDALVGDQIAIVLDITTR